MTTILSPTDGRHRVFLIDAVVVFGPPPRPFRPLRPLRPLRRAKA